jgi:hypothetical protein
MSMFGKLFLQSGCNLAGIGSLVPEKFDDHSLVILYLKRTCNRFSGPDREDYFLQATQLNPIWAI